LNAARPREHLNPAIFHPVKGRLLGQKFQLEVGVDDAQVAMTLRILADGGEVFSTRLEAPELDDLIRALGDGRAQLADEVSPELDEGARITNNVVDPSYLVGKNSAQGKALLAFRHPGLGWLGFQFRRPVVEAMVRQLDNWLHEEDR